MNNTETALLTDPRPVTPHRYQVYRQAKNGLHYSHGPIIESPEDAVALFLQTKPAFEGGGLRLWNHYEQRNVASAEWKFETTRMGFQVRTRSDVFHDDGIAAIARHIAQREALAEAIATDLRTSA